MKPVYRARHIFVFSRSADLVELIRKAADETIIVDSAASEAAGLLKLTEIRPDIIIIGRLDSRESALYRKLRDGWISHHASLLIVETNDSENTFRILGEENLTMSVGDYIFWPGSAAPFLPAEHFLPQ